MQLPATATLQEAATLAAGLPAEVSEGSGVLRVEAAALQHFDSSTIALLMQARRLATAAGRGFEVVGLPPKLTELAQLYGVADLLGDSALAPAGAAGLAAGPAAAP
jgi:phospholipid transport system transporter-binding protein